MSLKDTWNKLTNYEWNQSSTRKETVLYITIYSVADWFLPWL